MYCITIHYTTYTTVQGVGTQHTTLQYHKPHIITYVRQHTTYTSYTQITRHMMHNTSPSTLQPYNTHATTYHIIQRSTTHHMHNTPHHYLIQHIATHHTTQQHIPVHSCTQLVQSFIKPHTIQ